MLSAVLLQPIVFYAWSGSDYGVSNSAAVYLAQFYGGKQYKRVQESFRLSIVAVMLLILPLVFFFDPIPGSDYTFREQGSGTARTRQRVSAECRGSPDPAVSEFFYAKRYARLR